MVDGINGQNNISPKYEVAGEKRGVKRKNDNPPDWFDKAVKYLLNNTDELKGEGELGDTRDPGYAQPIIIDAPEDLAQLGKGLDIDEPTTKDPGFPKEEREPKIIYTENFHRKMLETLLKCMPWLKN